MTAFGAVLPHQPTHYVPLTVTQRIYLRFRRLVDVLLAGVGLIVVSVPMALVALGVLLTMGRPVIFRQERITRGGRIFQLRKFRSMRHAGPEGSAESDADRLVPFGRFIRAASLDELPSLWNILRGDMSLIGPRPLTTDYLGRFSAEQFTRHTVPAGLTGLAQVRGRNAVGWDDRLRMDQDYVRRFGPLLDLQILHATVLTVVRRQGVTDEGGVSMADFPGPQHSTKLELEGPVPGGEWVCRDRGGRIVTSGSSQILEDGVAGLEFRSGRQQGGADPEDLDEAIRLVLSRLRARHQAEWAVIAPGTELSDATTHVLGRAGFRAPSAANRFPSASPPPARVRKADAPLVAFIGLPDVDGATDAGTQPTGSEHVGVEQLTAGTHGSFVHRSP